MTNASHCRARVLSAKEDRGSEREREGNEVMQEGQREQQGDRPTKPANRQ